MKKLNYKTAAVTSALLLTLGIGSSVLAAQPVPVMENLQMAAKTSAAVPHRNERIPQTIEASALALPTKGAVIQTVTYIPKNPDPTKAGDYYAVRGSIKPVDAQAPDIEFQVNLPRHWNHKMVQFGGGGFNGTLVTADGQTEGQGAELVPPLNQGYVTFGSDGGHKGDVWDSTWAVNDEALHNFASDQLKKTKDTAYAIVLSYYGEKPQRTYFIGGSNGGREALMAAQRYPDDYDGIVSLYPVLNWIPKALKDHEDTKAVLAQQGSGWISPETFAVIKKVVTDTADASDGKKDGLIADPYAADAKLPEINQRLKDKLTPQQAAVWNQFLADKKFTPETLADPQVPVMPGYSVSQLLIDEDMNQFGSAPGKRDGMMMQFSDNVIKYQIMQDGNFDPDQLDEHRDHANIAKAAALLDATSPDLRAFAKHGGKMIILHGTADQLVAVKGTVDYIKDLHHFMGDKAASDLYRFYLAPGYGHGSGFLFTISRDLLNDLDQWVTKNKAPEALSVNNQNNLQESQVLVPQTLK
ncbi:tannase/feruloyl esterase family alpha/beta hydrolase [Megasphaera sp.]|uniref:tannase/feruloyl esterase family alpha/beta hydrolase n=1 Tax=Megasphaera TaxID=906 RepID=UPI001DC05EA3|nr:tannase/feruloyl esterase family alpha/beta hydrolase [Megasphaera sp.]MBS6789314.1 tannase/feruloyl esterase family alpha/beta hydrolase [Megasphaera sp.]